jgi:hypothetical protein
MVRTPGTVERGHSMKSRISEIGYAVMDLIEAYQIAKDCEYVRDPVCYALYQTWRKYDRARKEKEGDADAGTD